ncbi:hypothetical protein HETIRDRAFT_460782 [Heterobasidion irregulare TC 32-1]|uniref:Uncharacterized protein n=1 Tax=Heterobasidion irregulare (strain TC 32-1) TaxID=747525 RepID=W4JSA5_HETIT|nr:uncharacterized protein HETIRDRAFT_460782 [Heterobasidion irregulare TC 32-1]ETW76423.1 hypothetical protein HETIRDRAFT_460782 [Heterobasidion irregulare TC 32-1]
MHPRTVCIMKTIFAHTALVVSFILGAAAASVVDIPVDGPGRVPNPARCPNAQLVDTKYIDVAGDKVTYATYSCDHGDAAPTSSDALASRGMSSLTTLATRDATECTETPNCRCGQTCVATCNANTVNAPTLSNCQTLTQALKIVGTNNGIGQTFFVDPGNSVLFFFGDCGFEWDNLNKQTQIEYCWDDFANTETTLYTVCLGQSSNNKGGSCLSVTDDWQLSFDFV